MNNQDLEIAFNRLFDLFWRAVVQLMCAIVYCYVQMSHKRKVNYIVWAPLREKWCVKK
jgi:hypothetical protein